MPTRLIDDVKQRLQEVLGVEVPLEHPQAEEHGDFSTNIAMKEFAKSKLQDTNPKIQTNSNHQMNSNDQKGRQFKNPREYAQDLAGKIKTDDLIEKVEVAGPGFLNLSLQVDALIRECERVLAEADDYGKGEAGAGKTVVVDYSAPNIAKRFGIGHLRSTIIGQALYNLYAFLGYKTIGDNHLGDWGTQFGKLLFMISSHPNEVLTIDTLEAWYVEFHKHPEWDEEGRKWFKKLEDKYPVARELWQQCVDISMKEFERIYGLLSVNIDYSYGEAFYEDKMSIVIEDAKAKNIAVESQGALVIEIPGMATPLMLLKSDGATTYATRDLATLKFRHDTWNPDVIIYEVGNEQALHFQQVFAAAKLLGYVKPETELVHTKHGLYLNPDGKKFSTRKGDTVKLEEVLEEAIQRAKGLGSASEEAARQIGVGAIKYFDLSHNPQSDIVFDWETIMALEGNSGPYLQYTAARIQSVLNKSEYRISKSETRPNFKFQISNLMSEELRVLRYVYRFPEAVEAAARRFSPNLLCNYLYELAGRYNAFYNACPILSPESGRVEENKSIREFRLLLSAATGQILKNGLGILGIQAPERM